MVGNPHFGEIMGPDGSYTAGMHVLWGASLAMLEDQQDHPSLATPAFGSYPHALAGFTWDVVTIQPSFATLEGPRGDIALCEKDIQLVRARSPQARIYIYEAWPSIGKDAAPGAFLAKWSRSYAPGSVDGALYSHDYCRLLVARLRADDPQAPSPVLLLPVGSVLADLASRTSAGTLPGLPAIETLYRDGTHLGDLGNYIALMTWYAVLRQRSPVGLPGAADAPGITDAVAGEHPAGGLEPGRK